MLFGLLFWAFSDCQVWEMSKFEADIWQSWSTRNFFVIDTIVQKWSAFVPKFKTRLATYISWELVMEDIQYIQYIFEDHDPSLVHSNNFAMIYCKWKLSIQWIVLSILSQPLNSKRNRKEIMLLIFGARRYWIAKLIRELSN